jgi:carbon storage regulator
MIVIRRKPGESIWVSGTEVRILSLSPSRVKLGVEAPRDVPVLRGELVASMEQNRVAARASLPTDVKSLLACFREQARPQN